MHLHKVIGKALLVGGLLAVVTVGLFPLRAQDERPPVRPAPRVVRPNPPDDDDDPIEVRPAPPRRLPAGILDDEERVAEPVRRPSLLQQLRHTSKPDNDDDDEDVLLPMRRPIRESYKPEPFFKAETEVQQTYSHFRTNKNDPAMRFLNSKKISLNYRFERVGPSGVSSVEVWRTDDTRSWKMHQEIKEPKDPAFVIDVDSEGRHGFTLVPKSGVGLTRRIPETGDSPQIWIEVDLTLPVVKLHTVQVGSGRNTGNMTISWNAKDKNLGPEPVTLWFADESGKDWTPIVRKQKNLGQYTWRMPPTTPYKLLVRVTAEDKAGNIGMDQSAQPVLVDLAMPETIITGVEAIGK